MNIAEKLVKLLAERRLTVTTAESCTGGLVSALITSVSGASDVLECALVAYAPRIKHDFLGVPAETIERHGVISAECAAAMAEGAAKYFAADCALALTGYAGPTGGDRENPVGTVWIAAVIPIDGAHTSKTVTRRVQIEGDREAVRSGAALAALSLLFELLTENSD